MRTLALLSAASLTLAFQAPAHAGVGACVVSTLGVNTCVPPFISCQRGDVVTVLVFGRGTGLARCGDAIAACPATPVPCTASDGVRFGGVLSCEIDPYGTEDVTAICLVAPGMTAER